MKLNKLPSQRTETSLLDPENHEEDNETVLDTYTTEYSPKEPIESEAQGKLEIKVSLSLFKKLHEKARQEGVSVCDLATELLSEGLVLRAWEIMERKSAMKVSSSGNTSRNTRSPNSRNHYPQKGKYRSQPSSYQNKNQKKPKFSQNDLGDNANFIEYVRSQEKNNPW